jgi:hypothetical protein
MSATLSPTSATGLISRRFPSPEEAPSRAKEQPGKVAAADSAQKNNRQPNRLANHRSSRNNLFYVYCVTALCKNACESAAAPRFIFRR